MLHRCGWEHSCHSAPYTGSYGTVNTIVTQQPGLGNEDRTYSIEPEGKCIWWAWAAGAQGVYPIIVSCSRSVLRMKQDGCIQER